MIAVIGLLGATLSKVCSSIGITGTEPAAQDALTSLQGPKVMAAVDPRTLMWTKACEMIDRAEQLHRQFIRPAATPIHDLSWEPPVDITATNSGILITVALPGVDRDAVQVTVDDDGISVVGLRPPVIPPGSTVHRLEIPYGKFQRRIAFPAGRLQLGQTEFANGCLMLKFFK